MTGARDEPAVYGRAIPVALGMSPRMVYDAMGRPLETIATLEGRSLVEYWVYRVSETRHASRSRKVGSRASIHGNPKPKPFVGFREPRKRSRDRPEADVASFRHDRAPSTLRAARLPSPPWSLPAGHRTSRGRAAAPLAVTPPSERADAPVVRRDLPETPVPPIASIPSRPETGALRPGPPAALPPIVVPADAIYVCVVDSAGTRRQTVIELCRRCISCAAVTPKWGPANTSGTHVAAQEVACSPPPARRSRWPPRPSTTRR